MFRLIGTVLEQAAMDGITLLSEEDQGAAFIKMSLDWVREVAALKKTVNDLYGVKAVRASHDPVTDGRAIEEGAALVSGRNFTEDTRRRMSQHRVLPTSKQEFGGASESPSRLEVDVRCPHCGQILNG
jgi:copper chaperone CopZ